MQTLVSLVQQLTADSLATLVLDLMVAVVQLTHAVPVPVSVAAFAHAYVAWLLVSAACSLAAVADVALKLQAVAATKRLAIATLSHA